MQQTTIEQGKNVGDVAAITTAGAAWLQLTPEGATLFAALAAGIYTTLRIIGLLYTWIRACVKRYRDSTNGSA